MKVLAAIVITTITRNNVAYYLGVTIWNVRIPTEMDGMVDTLKWMVSSIVRASRQDTKKLLRLSSKTVVNIFYSPYQGFIYWAHYIVN